MRNTGIHSAAFLILVVFICAFCISCKDKDDQLITAVTFVLGDVTVKRGTDSHAAALKEVIKTGDIITTGAKSSLIIQTSEQDVFRIQENTVLAFTVMNRREKTLVLSNGSVLSKIAKLKKGTSCTVKTPIALASVRGTRFLTSYNGSVTVVAVGEGKVSVVKSGAQEENAVDAGKTAVVETAVDIRDNNTPEKAELDKLEAAQYLEKADTMNADEFDAYKKKIMEADEKLDGASSKLMTLEEIRARYGRIDEITLYSGRTVKGAVISRGSTFTVITPGGKRYIAANKIKRTTSR